MTTQVSTTCGGGGNSFFSLYFTPCLTKCILQHNNIIEKLLPFMQTSKTGLDCIYATQQHLHSMLFSLTGLPERRRRWQPCPLTILKSAFLPSFLPSFPFGGGGGRGLGGFHWHHHHHRPKKTGRANQAGSLHLTQADLLSLGGGSSSGSR